MKCIASALLLAFAAPAAAAGVSPIDKVLQLMSDLQTKVLAEGQASQKAYEEFSEFCEDRARDLSHDIKTGTEEVNTLKATIAENSATMVELTAKIEGLAADIATDEADATAANEIRAKESADFKAEESELMTTIDMLQRAVGILEREMSKGSGAFLQVKNAQSLAGALAAMVQASFMSSADEQRLTALVQSSSEAAEDDEEPGAPAAAVYESKSGDIVETLRNLMEKAESQLDAARKAETTNLHNFEMLAQSLADEIKFANKDMADAKQGLAVASESKAVAEGDEESTSKDLQADIAAKADLHQECMSRAEDFEGETKSRGEELEAIAKAKQIIAETTANAAEATYSEGAASLLQLSSRADLAGLEVVRMVRDLARKGGSKAMSLLAQRVASAAHSRDPFEKIKGLISDMIAKLEEEHSRDASHNAYCDKEVAETTEKKDVKTTEVEKLSTKIDQMTAHSSQLKEEVAALQKALSQLSQAQAEMDKMRAQEKEAFTKNQADLEQGLAGVKAALKVLNEYYAKDAAHGAAQGSSTGVIGLLEVIESDFSKNLAEVVSNEEAAVAVYEQATKDGDIERAAKSKDVEYKVAEAARLDKDSATLAADRSNVQGELDAILEYFAKIQGECAEVAETYEERKARRDSELAGLKEALTVLENETSLVQKRALRRRFRGSVLKA